MKFNRYTSFYLGEVRDPLAEIRITYRDENIIAAESTKVSETLKGQGVGRKLVEELVNYARKENKKIIPICPFVLATFEKTPEYADIWHK
ncbi:MAG TPA: N-acetyltransferase [Tissierellia bacterium]|jgi:predicted GNAT family acetyltransferase|nr:N-acetyltransferase [Tissierellia bacterium]